MSATALILFTQDANTDAAGKAVLGTFGDFSDITVTNGDNTNVVSWTIFLLDAPPDSTGFPPGDQPQILAQATDNAPTATFTPDAAGTYRVMLEVSDGVTKDRDIRCFGIPDARGFVRPPYQENPQPLPVALPGLITVDPRPIKPDEQNYGANVRGWAGNGAVGQLDQFLRQYDDLPPQSVTTTPFTADETGGPLYVVNVSGSPAFNLPLAPRTGFVVRIVNQGDPLLVAPQGGGTIDGGSNATLDTLEGAIFVHQGTNVWLILAKQATPSVVHPLFNYIFVDPGTSVPSGQRNGSVAAPFGLIQDAITGLGGYPSLSSSFTVLCSAPSFENLTPGSGSYSLNLISDSPEYLTLGTVTLTASRLVLTRFVVSGALSNSGLVEAINTDFGSDLTGSEVALTGSATSSASHSVTGTITSTSSGVSACFYSLQGPVVCDTTLTLVNCDVQGDLTTADGTLLSCTMNGQTVTVTGVLTVDVATYNSMLASSVTVTGGGTVRVLVPGGSQQSSIAWDASSPVTITALPAGHSPGTYAISGVAVVRTGAGAGTVARGIAWNSPTLGADSVTSSPAPVTAIGTTLTDANFIVSDGSADIDVTFTPASITGSPVIDLYVAANLHCSSA